LSNKHESFYEAKRSPRAGKRGKGDHLTNNQRFLKMRDWRARHQFAKVRHV
jgi:hypothetical protein